MLSFPSDRSIFSTCAGWYKKHDGRWEKRRRPRNPHYQDPSNPPPPPSDGVCAKSGVWSPNPLFCSVRPRNPLGILSVSSLLLGPCLDPLSAIFGLFLGCFFSVFGGQEAQKCRLRDLRAVYRVLYQAQGWRETLSSGGKHCPLWGLEGLGN